MDQNGLKNSFLLLFSSGYSIGLTIFADHWSLLTMDPLIVTPDNEPSPPDRIAYSEGTETFIFKIGYPYINHMTFVILVLYYFYH